MGKRTLHHMPQPPKRKGGAQPGNQHAKGNKGGGAPKGNTNTLIYGLYADGLYESEKAIWAHIPVGSLEDEIKMTRIMLSRACRGQVMWERQNQTFNEQIRQNVKAALGSTVAAEFFHVESVEVKEGVVTADMVVEGEEVPIAMATPTSETKVIRRKKDFSEEILKYTRMLRSLEETQVKLMEEGSGEDYARRLAEDIRLFGDNAMATMPGQGYTKEEV